MKSEPSQLIIHTEVRCTLDSDTLDILVSEMRAIEEKHGPVLWKLCNGVDYITPCNREKCLFYFEAVPFRPSAYV